MMRAAARALTILCAVRAALGVAYVSVIPRGDGMHVMATLPNLYSAISVAVSAVDTNGAVLLKSSSNVAGSMRADMGILANEPKGELTVTTTTASSGSVPLVQQFVINTAAAVPLPGLVWLPDSNGITYTLTPIPSEWANRNARWSAVCSGVPPVLLAPWANRSVDATATALCTAQVTMDTSGFVTSDILSVQGGAFAPITVDIPSSGSATPPAVLMASLVVWVATVFGSR